MAVLNTIGTSNAFSTTKRCSFCERCLARGPVRGRHGGVKQLAIAGKLDAAGVEIGVFENRLSYSWLGSGRAAIKRHAAGVLLGGAEELGRARAGGEPA